MKTPALMMNTNIFTRTIVDLSERSTLQRRPSSTSTHSDATSSAETHTPSPYSLPMWCEPNVAAATLSRRRPNLTQCAQCEQALPAGADILIAFDLSFCCASCRNNYLLSRDRS